MTLSTKQIIAASQIAFGESHKQAAKMAKVTPGTISEWIQYPEFKAKINEIQLNALNDAQARFRGLASSAVNALSDIIAKSRSEKLRFEAAKYVLETIKIAPAKEGGLWWVGPTTEEEVESAEHEQAIRNRLKEMREELDLPFA